MARLIRTGFSAPLYHATPRGDRHESTFELIIKVVKWVQQKAGIQGDELSISRAQHRAPAPALAKIAAKHHEHNDAAYATGAYSYREIAAYYGLPLATVDRVIRGQILQYD